MKALNSIIKQIGENYQANRAHVLESYTKSEEARIPAWRVYLDAAEETRD